MQLARSLSPAPPPRPWLVPGMLCAAILLIGISLFARGVDHDESQYVAAIALMRSGLPYRDFAYLQTPLQPLLLSPLAYLPAGWTFIAMRLANGVFGFATILFLYKTLAERASRAAIVISLASLLCTDAFLLASSLARNDALTMVLLAAALPPLLSGIESMSPRRLAMAGLCLGLATSAKISAALPTAGVALFILLHWQRLKIRGVAGFLLGLTAGLLPILVAAALAPNAFRFDVLSYNLKAPVQWWTSIGERRELDPLIRALKLFRLASVGSALVALVAVVAIRPRSDDHRVLDAMIIGAVAAAYLPAPALTQYLVPLLPPLFARFALALDATGQRQKRVLIVLAGLGSIAGLVSSFVVRSTDFEVIRRAGLGREVAALAQGGPVVTLSPEFVAGTGVNLDARFAAGPFLYRIRGPLARTAETEGRAVSVQWLEEGLDSRRPSLILVGGEAQRFPLVFPDGLDQPLVTWARSRGYRPQQLGSGFTAFVDPGHAHGRS